MLESKLKLMTANSIPVSLDQSSVSAFYNLNAKNQENNQVRVQADLEIFSRFPIKKLYIFAVDYLQIDVLRYEYLDKDEKALWIMVVDIGVKFLKDIAPVIIEFLNKNQVSSIEIISWFQIAFDNFKEVKIYDFFIKGNLIETLKNIEKWEKGLKEYPLEQLKKNANYEKKHLEMNQLYNTNKPFMGAVNASVSRMRKREHRGDEKHLYSYVLHDCGYYLSLGEEMMVDYTAQLEDISAAKAILRSNFKIFHNYLKITYCKQEPRSISVGPVISSTQRAVMSASRLERERPSNAELLAKNGLYSPQSDKPPQDMANIVRDIAVGLENTNMDASRKLEYFREFCRALLSTIDPLRRPTGNDDHVEELKK